MEFAGIQEEIESVNAEMHVLKTKEAYRKRRDYKATQRLKQGLRAAKLSSSKECAKTKPYAPMYATLKGIIIRIMNLFLDRAFMAVLTRKHTTLRMQGKEFSEIKK